MTDVVDSSDTKQEPARRRPARRGQGAALRAEILDAATRMIAREGTASALTLRAVAREVGVAATSIYLHFESVEMLLSEVKENQQQTLADLLTAAANEAGADPLARLRARGRAYVRFGDRYCGEYSVMFAAKLALPNVAAEPSTPTSALLADIRAELRAVDRPGREPMDEEEAWMVSLQLWAGLHGMVTLRMVRPLTFWPPAEKQSDDLIDRMLGLI
jgi:AcrR family transcriptional regulator